MLSRLLGKRIKNDDTCMSFNEYPFIRKFPEKITFNTDSNSWIYFYNRKGELVRR